MLTFTVLRNFSKYSSRNTVPWIFKDARFTKKGILNKLSPYRRQYDLSQPHIKNPHLYFDRKVDLLLMQEEERKLKQLQEPFAPLPQVSSTQEGVFQDTRTRENVLRELLDQWLLTQGDAGRLLYNIALLEHKEQKDVQFWTHCERTFRYTLTEMAKRIQALDIHQLCIFTDYCLRYALDVRDIWNTLQLNLYRLLYYREYHDNLLTKIEDVAQRQKIAETIIATLDNAQKHKFELPVALRDALARHFKFHKRTFAPGNERFIQLISDCIVVD